MRIIILALGLAAALVAGAGGWSPAVSQEPDLVEQRRALLELRSQARALERAVNALIEALGPAAIPPRARPAMIDCPWEMPDPPQEEAAADSGQAAPPGVVARPRRSIPDCYPPGWETPAEWAEWGPPALPEDRPSPLVESYLSHIVRPPPPELVERFQLDTTHYKKHADAQGYPILASEKVPDEALAIVRDQVNYMLGFRSEIRDAMIKAGARIVIMAETEYTMDIPEQRNWTVPKYRDPRLTAGERSSYFEPGGLGYRSAEAYWNARARGMGGTLTSCTEENVLGYYGTRYWGTNICIHEFAHGIMGAGIANHDPEWHQDIVDAYHAAREADLRTVQGYAGNTFNEYWAVNLEWYLGVGGRDRAELKEVDPRGYELFTRLIPEDRFLTGRANVADRSRDEMSDLVRELNPEWWEREQVRQQAREAERQRRGRDGQR